jgi:hypothetical protein
LVENRAWTHIWELLLWLQVQWNSHGCSVCLKYTDLKTLLCGLIWAVFIVTACNKLPII